MNKIIDKLMKQYLENKNKNYSENMTTNPGKNLGDTTGNIASGFLKGGPVGAVVELAKASKEAGANALNNSKNLGQQTLNMTNDISKNTSDLLMNETPNTTQNVNIAPINTNRGVMTGGAADILNGLNQNNNTALSEYQNYLGDNSALSSAISNAAPMALAKEGKFNNPVMKATINKLPETNIINKLANGLGDFQSGYQENRNNGFSPVNLQKDDSKGVMNRIGEVAGTVGRIAQNPLVQGLGAMGIAAATGNPQPLLAGVGYAQKRAMDNVYRDVLAQNGINLPQSTLGNVTSNDMKTIANIMETKRYHDVWNDYHQGMYEAYINYLENKIETDKQNANSKKISANANMVRAQKTGQKGGNRSNGNKNISNVSSNQYVLMKSPNGKIYRVPENQINRYKKAGGKIVG